jgi:hypothetical protein
MYAAILRSTASSTTASIVRACRWPRTIFASLPHRSALGHVPHSDPASCRSCEPARRAAKKSTYVDAILFESVLTHRLARLPARRPHDGRCPRHELEFTFARLHGRTARSALSIVTHRYGRPPSSGSRPVHLRFAVAPRHKRSRGTVRIRHWGER